MKKILEIIAVSVVVLCLIGAGICLLRGPLRDARTAPGPAEDQAPTTIIIGGGP